jgi:hypothetical protein
MTAAVTANLVSGLTNTETFPNSSGGPVPFAPFNENVTLNAGTTPPVSMETQFALAMTSGSATLDLTNVPDCSGQTVLNGTGLKLAFVKFQNPAGNANSITIANGGSNPYRLDAATGTFTFPPLAPGQSMLINLDGAGDTIGSSHKTFAITGTGAQALNVQVSMG